eukprot:scaffold1302_cov165-Ochromonas_danica.AAC.5
MTSSSYTTTITSSDEEETEKQKQLKMAKQLEFQREALARMNTMSKRPTSLPTPVVNNVNMIEQKRSSMPRSGDGSGKEGTPVGQLPAPPAPPSVGQDSPSAPSSRSKSLLTKYSQSMTSITPTPSFVVKTKRSSGIKVFINICSHNQIPYKAEGNVGDATNAFDKKKQIYMILNTPFEYQNEKDGNYCVIYDIIVHPSEIYVSTIDSTGVARDRAMDLIAASYQEQVDTNYVILRISNNYKGKDESGRLTVRPCYVPPSEAFYVQAQIAAWPSPAGNAESISGRTTSVAEDVSSASSMARSSIALKSTDRSSQSRGSVVDRSYSVIASDSSRMSLDKSIKAMVMSKDLLSAFSAGRSFNHVIDALNNYEVNVKDMIIYPEAGFVIIAKQIRPVMNIIINVCHHLGVGSMANMFETHSKVAEYVLPPIVPPAKLPKPLPFIIGRVVEQPAGLSMGQSAASSGGKMEMLVDLVIPTAVMLLVIQDPTGDLREELAKEILIRLSSLRVYLENSFSLPVVSGGYVSPNLQYLTRREDVDNATAGMIAPVINLTEVEKLTYSVAFIGKLFKQGHRYKSWKERLVYVNDTTNKLQYYDLKMVYQGEFGTENAYIECIADPNECSAPKDSFPFKLNNYVSGGEYLYCYVKENNLRSQFVLLFEASLRMATAMNKLLKIPDVKQGWLKKQGHVVKNWKRRFFILSQGLLNYYENNGQDTNGLPEIPKGSIKLSSCTVSIVVNDEYNKPIPPTEQMFQVVDEIQGNKLLMKAENETQKKEWLDAIRKHIEYARNYLESCCQSLDEDKMQ